MNQKARNALKTAALLGVALTPLVLPGALYASTVQGNANLTGSGLDDAAKAFDPLYDFVYSTATGTAARSVCIAGGFLGMVGSLATGKIMPAGVGVGLAVFGITSPTIVNTLFTSALI